jgi:signal transduction histidine kinase
MEPLCRPLSTMSRIEDVALKKVAWVAMLLVALSGVGVGWVVTSSLRSSAVIVHRADAAIMVSGLGSAMEASAESTRRWLESTLEMGVFSVPVPEGSHSSIMDHPELAGPVNQFRETIHRLDLMLGGQYHNQVVTVARLHGDYVRALQGLHHALDSDETVEAIYYRDTLPHEAAVRIELSSLRDRLNQELSTATSDVARAGTLLRWAVPALMALAIGACLGVVWILTKLRHARERTWRDVAAAKNEFLARVSHELRTPLTAVLGFAAELDDGWERLSERERIELTDMIRSQADEVSMMVEDLLVAARTEIGNLRVVAEPIRVSAAVDVALAGSNLPRHRVQPGSHLDRVSVNADPGRLRQILRNLFANAARYGGDHVRVSTAETDDHVVISVADDGAGVPQELRQAIFEPYFRGPQAIGQPASIGLGLAVSRELARLMNGDLDYRIDQGWSTFDLTLPRASTPAGERDRSGSLAAVSN